MANINTKLAVIQRTIQVGIWENLEESVTIYADRTVIKSWKVQWQNNSGSLKPTRERLTGKHHAEFLKALENAKSDDVEPEEYIFEALFESQY